MEASTTETTKILSRDQVDSFERDGYLFVKGLLSDEELDDVTAAAEEVSRRRAGDAANGPQRPFSIVEKGVMFSAPSSPSSSSDDVAAKATASTSSSSTARQNNSIVQAFRRVAVRSKMAKISAELMQLDPESQNVRILRDVFLAKPVNSSEFCDYHVDDQGFWPEQYHSEATEMSGRDQHGINAWVALDDMPSRYEGSMAVAPGSHVAEWREEAYRFIGQRERVGEADEPETTRDDLVRAFAGAATGAAYTTCGIGRSNPELRERIDRTRVVFDLQRGDVVFATRLLFHRTLEVTPEGKEFYASIGKDSLMRYSVRYVPGTARLPLGYHPFEWSVAHSESNGGLKLDDVVDSGNDDGDDDSDGAMCWYPKVWPTIEDGLDEKLDALASEKLPQAKAKADSEWKALIESVQVFQANMLKEGNANKNGI